MSDLTVKYGGFNIDKGVLHDFSSIAYFHIKHLFTKSYEFYAVCFL
jgi:hypothetical protein